MIKTILIVDDSKAAQFFLKGCIPQDMGYEIHIAGDGREGLKKYDEIRPDITFLDLTMPEMDGIAALTEIKKFDPDAIVVVLTANIQRKIIREVENRGAFSVLKKPPKKEQIRGVLYGAGKELEKKELPHE